MKLADVVVGGRYRIRLGSGAFTVVRVTSDSGPGRVRRFLGTNEQSGRELGPFSAARLRGPAYDA